MFIRENKITAKNDRELLVSFDLEWTKNYKIKNGNRPFCFSFVFFSLEDIPDDIEELGFGFCSYYIETVQEEKNLVEYADVELKKFINSKAVIVGHQLSSDISVLLNFDEFHSTPNFSNLRRLWHRRKQETQQTKIFDTRYDLNSMLNEKSRRLVDVCAEFQLDVTQPELKGSMTKMHNYYMEKKDISTLERLAVLNLRHGLSAAILYSYYRNPQRKVKPVNVNRIIHRNLSLYYKYGDCRIKTHLITFLI